MQIKLSSQHGNLHNFYVNEKYVHNREFLKVKKKGTQEFKIIIVEDVEKEENFYCKKFNLKHMKCKLDPLEEIDEIEAEKNSDFSKSYFYNEYKERTIDKVEELVETVTVRRETWLC